MLVPSKFRPSWWLRNPHLQTLWAARCRSLPLPDVIRERIELPDGDFVDVAWSQKNTGDIVCLFHGLTGSIDSNYIKGMFAALETAGFSPVLMHFRGCSGEPNRTRRTYHSGHTDDIRYFINQVKQRHPTRRILAIGYSLGANALLKYLGEESADCPLTGAAAVSPPLVLAEGANRMNQGLSRGYQKHLISLMLSHHEQRRRAYPHLNLSPAPRDIKNFWEFDDRITAPLNGFDGVDHYYTVSSSRQFLQSIEVPTHIVHSLDDPFFTPDVVPREDELSKSVVFEVAQYGGHVGFVTGNLPFRATFWLESRLPAVLLAMANETNDSGAASHD